MKRVFVATLLASGLLFAAKHDNASTTRISGDERLALATQSPRVHPQRTHKHMKANRRADQVVANKHTVNAYIPYGK